MLVIANDDENKVFNIGFRTPPYDDSGIPHILEHSVLCGSRKYPVKDPFVELAKGSLNTFLNAMTYSDKTVYPIASCNEKDFENLMDVYLDAVFYPNIYEHTEIMRQAYTTVGYLAFIVGTAIVLFIVVALLGFDSVFKGTGRILLLAAIALGLLIGMMCRCIVGSAAKLDKEYLYCCKIPGRWKRYAIADIREQANEHKPFYHVVRGYVMMTSQGVVAIPVATYKGGREFLKKLTEYIGEPMVDVMPEMVASKRSEESKKAEAAYKEYKDSLKEKGAK